MSTTTTAKGEAARGDPLLNAGKDPLAEHQPHTPHLPFREDSRRPTCSEPTSKNKGCAMWNFCPVKDVAERHRGPVQLAIEDTRGGVAQGNGRRTPMWCFNAAQLYFRNAKPGFAVAPDRVYYEMEASGKIHKNERGENIVPPSKWVAKRLPAYESQGPYYRRPESAAPIDDLARQKDELLRGAGS